MNGRVYTPDLLTDAIKTGKETSKPMTLLVIADDYYKTCTIDYHGGLRYPHLVRKSKPDYLDDLIKPVVGRSVYKTIYYMAPTHALSLR